MVYLCEFQQLNTTFVKTKIQGINFFINPNFAGEFNKITEMIFSNY